MAVGPQLRRFTVEEYYRMGEAGILGEDDRVELIHGEIVQMSPIGPRHASSVLRLTNVFSRHFSSEALVLVQSPVRLSDLSEPQPDLALLRRRDDFYAGGHPGPRDAFLIVEVADTSLGYDRSIKARLYAAAGVRELWIVDLVAGQIEVYRHPGPNGYGDVSRVAGGDRLAPEAFPDVALPASDILGA